MAAPAPRLEQETIEKVKRASVATAILLVLLLLAGLAMFAADFLGLKSPQSVVNALRRAPYVTSVLLVAVEEGGIPVPVPGDVAVMYAAQAVPRTFTAWAAIWVALMIAVIGGSSVLYLLGRRWGTQLARGRLGVALHLNEERLEKLERWFSRWGAIAVFGGRLLPGGRQPISAAAGTFGVPYKVFLPSTALAAAVWITAFVALGVTLGPKAESILSAHHTITTILVAIGLLGGIGYIGFRLLTVKPDQDS